jgi:hypothetical protein
MGILNFLFRCPRPAPLAVPPAVDPFEDRRAQRDLQWRQLLQNVEHPCELVPGTQAQPAFEAAQALGRKEGFSPLIVQPGFNGRILTEPRSLKDNRVRMASEYFAWRADELAPDTDGLSLFDHVSEVAPIDDSDQIYVVDWMSGTTPLSDFAEVAILRLPCANCWEIPSLIDVGEPSSDSRRTTGEEIGIEKDWHDRFGAELCCVGPRSWQFRVARPPRDHGEAVALLREHYLYSWVDGADDNETIENGAASLRVARHWMFFWS